MKHKFLVAFLLYAIHSPTHAADMCDSAGGDDAYGAFDDVFAELAEEPMPKMKASFSLASDCSYSVKTSVEFTTAKSVDELMAAITSVENNKRSANSNLKDFKLESAGTNTWTQTVKASKSGVTATIKNRCTLSSAGEARIYSCNLADGDGKIESNRTTITCYSTKRCDFVTTGKAKPYKSFGITIKGPCDLSAGGAAETANGIFRLSQYIAQGKVTDALWISPGANFYSRAVEVREGSLPGSTGSLNLHPYP